MKHFLAWEEHHKLKYIFLTLVFCVLTDAIRFRQKCCLEFVRKVQIILTLLLQMSSAECSPKSITQPCRGNKNTSRRRPN